MFMRITRLIGALAVFGLMQLAVGWTLGPSVWAAANNQNDPTKQGLFIEQVTLGGIARTGLWRSSVG